MKTFQHTRQFILIIILTVTLSQSYCQAINNEITSINNYEIVDDNEQVIIPFEMFGQNIRMKVKINGHAGNFLLDQGSLWDSLFFFGSPKVDAMKLNIVGDIVLGNPDVPNPIVADIATNASVDFGPIIFKNQPAVVSRYIKGLPNPWEGADGQISAAFFKNFIVKIDWDKLTISLIKPEKFEYRGKGEIISMKKGPHNARTVPILIEFDDATTTKMDLLIDLGGIWPIYLPDNQPEKIKIPTDAKQTRIGMGGLGTPEYGKVGSVKSVSIGSQKLDNVVAAFVPTEGNASVYSNSMIGLPLLERFNIYFDYTNERIILEPSEKFSNPFILK